jgi:hypothetical protein
MDDGGADNQQALLGRKNFKLQFLRLRVRENYQRRLLIGHDIKVNGKLIFRAGRPQIVAHCGFPEGGLQGKIAAELDPLQFTT